MTEKNNPTERILMIFDNDLYKTLIAFGKMLLGGYERQFGRNNPIPNLTKQKIKTLFDSSSFALYLLAQRHDIPKSGSESPNGFEDDSLWFDKEGKPNEKCKSYLSIRKRHIFINDEVDDIVLEYGGDFERSAVIIDFLEGTVYSPEVYYFEDKKEQW